MFMLLANWTRLQASYPFIQKSTSLSISSPSLNKMALMEEIQNSSSSTRSNLGLSMLLNLFSRVIRSNRVSLGFELSKIFISFEISGRIPVSFFYSSEIWSISSSFMVKKNVDPLPYLLTKSM